MKRFNNVPLAYKLPAIIVALALFAACATAALIISGTKAQIHDMAESRLTNAADARKKAVVAGITRVEAFLHAQRDNPSIQTALRDLSSAWRDLPGDPADYLRGVYIEGRRVAEGDVGDTDAVGRYDSAHEAIDLYMREVTEGNGFQDTLLIDLQGNVLYTAAKEEDFAANLVSGPLADTGLGEVFKAASAGDSNSHFSDIALYEPHGNVPSRFTAVEVMDHAGQPLGMIAVQNSGTLDAIVQFNPQLGETGETYLVGEDHVLRTNLKHAETSTALTLTANDEAIDLAIEGKTGVAWIVDYEGIEVLAAYTPITFGDITWALISEQSRAEIFAPVDTLVKQVVLQLLVAAAIICAIGVIVARGITVPMRAVGDTMGKVAQRDYAVEIPAIQRGDEIGSIAKSLARFRDDLAANDKMIAEQTEQRVVIEAEQSRVVDQLSGSLASLADGDLTIRIDEPFVPEYEALRINFNEALVKLEGALSSVVVTAVNIRDESIQVSQAADDLSHRTENQAAALEETAASLEELTASVKAASQSAERANTDVVATKQNAEESGRIVRDAVEAMSEIEKSSEHISQIIGVIDDIAFQTNLLALNAGVEAARAGDAGRGFAVVASEVRALAQRSSDAAKEIKALISTSSQHVGRGVNLVGETGKSLQTIVESVTGITTLIGNIASSAREQSVGLTEINTAVNQLDQVTQQNAAMVEEATAASHAMKTEAESLSALVSQFKANAPHGAAPAHPPASRAAKAPARAGTSSVTKLPTRDPAPKMARVARSNGSVAVAQSSAAEDWQEF